MNNVRSAWIGRGLLALVVGVIAVAWPGITVEAFVILFAFYAFIAAGGEAARVFGSDQRGSVVIFRILLAAFDVGAGVAALAWPGITVLALVWLVAFWAFATGVAELATAFADGESAGERVLLGLGGFVSVALGAVFAVRPDIGAVTIARLFGLFTIAAGIFALVIAADAGRRRSAAQLVPS